MNENKKSKKIIRPKSDQPWAGRDTQQLEQIRIEKPSFVGDQKENTRALMRALPGGRKNCRECREEEEEYYPETKLQKDREQLRAFLHEIIEAYYRAVSQEKDNELEVADCCPCPKWKDLKAKQNMLMVFSCYLFLYNFGQLLKSCFDLFVSLAWTLVKIIYKKNIKSFVDL